MHTLHQLTAAPTTIELNGATYQLAPLSVRDLGRIERMATATHVDPSRASLAEVHQWLGGREGTAYALWLALRRRQPKITGAWCREVVAACTPDELLAIQQALDEACGASLVAGDAPPAAESLHPSQRHRPIPWERIFRALSQAYGWTPRQLARMTLGQLVAYLDDDPPPTDRVRLPAAEARALARETRKKRRGQTSKRGGTPNDQGDAALPFDGMLALVDRLRTLGDELSDGPCASALLPGERAGFVDRAPVRGAGLRGVDSHVAIARDNSALEQHRRQTEVLERMEENLRRLRELVETRSLAAALFVETSW